MKVLRTESRWHNTDTLYQSHNKVHKLSYDIDMLIFSLKGSDLWYFLHSQKQSAHWAVDVTGQVVPC